MDWLKNRHLRRWLLLLVGLCGGPLFAAQKVQVAAVHFPPYVIKPESGLHQGLLVQVEMVSPPQ